MANWHRMLDDLSYWDIFNQPSPLDHTWSLAIEEQFYLFWPLVVMGVLWLLMRRGGSRGTAAVRTVALVGAASSLLVLALVYAPGDSNRAYFGTDARLGPILLGAALAAYVARRPRRAAPPAWRVETAGALAMAWLLWSLVTVDGRDGWYYQGGLALFAVAAAVVIAAITGGPPGRLAALLAWKPLAALGLISYGVYLWHWPIVVYLNARQVEKDLHVTPPDWVIDLARIAVTLGISVASYKLVELPIRRGVLKGRQLLLATPAVLSVILALILITTVGSAPARLAAMQVGQQQGPDPQSLYPASIPPGAQRILLVGDSGTYFLGPALVEEAEQTGRAAVATWAELRTGCVLAGPEGAYKLWNGEVWDFQPCHDARRQDMRELARTFEPDIVVYYLANAGAIGYYRLEGEWVDECDPSYKRYFHDAMTQDLEALRPNGPTPIVLATTPYLIDVEGSRARVDCRNASYRELAADVEAAEIVDLNAFIAQEAAGNDTEMADLFRDRVHLSDDGATRAARWLLTQLGILGQ